MSDTLSRSAPPDLSTFMNYEYEIDPNGDSAAAYLLALAGKNKRVLEIGAGSGVIARALVELNQCEVVAIEINPLSIEKLKVFCNSVYSVDLNDADWPSALAGEEKFDCVIAGDVLEHLYDPWAVLKRMKSLLNDDGHILLSLPHAGYRGMLACLAQEDFAYGEWGLLDKTHIRFFGLHNIQALYENAGLAIEEARFVVKDPEEVEFGARWAALSSSEQRAFARNKFSSVYQVITKAASAQRVANALNLSDIEPPRTKSAARAAVDDIPAKGATKLIAFYLPQFHPIPENDQWWGRGFTEWTNVTKAEPLFPGHDQPHLPTELGFYDLRMRQTRRDQIDLAKTHGIDGFCYHYYWFSGHRLLNAPLDDMLADSESDMPFCICWANENWTRRWDAAENEVLIAQLYRENDDLEFIKQLAPLFKDPRYIRVDGAPFFIVYRPQHLPDARKTVAIWRDYCESIGVPEIHVACAFSHSNWDYKQFGFDSGVEFPPHNSVKASLSPEMKFHNEFNGHVFDMADVAELYLAREYSEQNEGYRCVFPSWDNTPRRGAIASVGLNGTPRNYEYWLSQAIANTRKDYPGQDRMVFINAWNEWAEGCHLEPCRQYGRQFLEATWRAKNGLSRETCFADRGIPAVARLHPVADDGGAQPQPVAPPPPESATAVLAPPALGKDYSRLRRYLRRYVLALKGRDDHRFVNSVHAPLAALADERNRLASQLALSVSEQKNLTRELAGRRLERDEIARRLASFKSEPDRLAALVCQRPPENVLDGVAVRPSRVTSILTHLQSDRVERLRSLLKVDGYDALGVTLRRLPRAILDVNTGLVVLPDGSLEESARCVASYYTEVGREGLAKSVRDRVTGEVTPDVVHVFHRSCGAFGHFVLDGLCAVALLSETIRNEKLKILIPDFLPGWAVAALAELGFDEYWLVRVSGVVLCRNMTLSSLISTANCFSPNPYVIDKIKKFAGVPAVVKSPRRIFLTREGAHSPRFVLNEAAVEKEFRLAGFEIVNPARMTFREQIELFACASVVAGHHGSAFVNVIFAPVGAHVIDLMPEHWIGYWGETSLAERWVFNLTGACDQNYSLILSPSSMVGEPYLPNGPKELPKIETEVDIDLLRSALSDLPGNV